MEKNAFLKTRVSEETKADFEAICGVLKKTPTLVLREIVEDFVDQKIGLVSAPFVVDISRPESYQYGAWRVLINLRDPGILTWNGSPVPFQLPEFPNRIFHVDREYQAVIFKQVSGEMAIGGQFIRGEWKADLYSNGISEDKNRSPITAVKSALEKTIGDLVNHFEVYLKENS